MKNVYFTINAHGVYSYLVISKGTALSKRFLYAFKLGRMYMRVKVIGLGSIYERIKAQILILEEGLFYNKFT